MGLDPLLRLPRRPHATAMPLPRRRLHAIGLPWLTSCEVGLPWPRQRADRYLPEFGDLREKPGDFLTLLLSLLDRSPHWRELAYRVSVSLSKVWWCCSSVPFKIRPRMPRTAIAPTTSSQNGSTPKPGIASRASPGNSSHCRPSTMNSSSAVPKSTTQTIGGKGVAKAPMASDMPAMAKARASRFLENLTIFEVGVPALVGGSLVS